MKTNHFALSSTILFVLFSYADFVSANQSLEEIQRQFNMETISKPFSVPDDATLTKSLESATERGLPTQSKEYLPKCVGAGCAYNNTFGYRGYLGGFIRPGYGGFYNSNYYRPYYGGWW